MKNKMKLHKFTQEQSQNEITNRLSVEITQNMALLTIPLQRRLLLGSDGVLSAFNPTHQGCSSPTQADQGQ